MDILKVPSAETIMIIFIASSLRAAEHPYMSGKGGRLATNGWGSIQGLSVKSTKHHVALQPLFIIVGGGIILVAAYVVRHATRNPDLNWTKRKDIDDIVGEYDGKQFKFINISGIDYAKYGHAVRPNYED